MLKYVNYKQDLALEKVMYGTNTHCLSPESATFSGLLKVRPAVGRRGL